MHTDDYRYATWRGGDGRQYYGYVMGDIPDTVVFCERGQEPVLPEGHPRFDPEADWAKGIAARYPAAAPVPLDFPLFYVDELVDQGANAVPGSKNKLWCHLWTDGTVEELDAFAKRIGLRTSWRQLSHGAIVREFHHYDLTPAKRRLALDSGAHAMSLKDYLRQLKAGIEKP